MKTPLFFIAAIIAFFALPFDFTTMISALFCAGFAAIIFADYRRNRHSFDLMSLTPLPAKQSLRLAA